MEIGIIGAGNIGSTIAKHFIQSSRSVKSSAERARRLLVVSSFITGASLSISGDGRSGFVDIQTRPFSSP
ncbi:MAG: NAD(P)-binding domain-containing protein [Halobacteriales archaeon]